MSILPHRDRRSPKCSPTSSDSDRCLALFAVFFGVPFVTALSVLGALVAIACASSNL